MKEKKTKVIYTPFREEAKRPNYLITCLYCGEKFGANKSTALYCCSLCRGKHYREKQALKQSSTPPKQSSTKKKTAVKSTNCLKFRAFYEIKDYLIKNEGAAGKKAAAELISKGKNKRLESGKFRVKQDGLNQFSLYID